MTTRAKRIAIAWIDEYEARREAQTHREERRRLRETNADLLAALEGFGTLIGEGMIDELVMVDPLIQGDVDAALELVRAAIAKARGQ